MTRDPFGLLRCYYDVGGRCRAPTVRAIFDALPNLPRTLDRIAVAAHLEGRTTPDRSFFAAVRSVPPGHVLVPGSTGFTTRPYEIEPCAGDLRELLCRSIAAALEQAPRPMAVALSGGLDSALVLALVRQLDPEVPALMLAPRLEGYSELDAATLTAQSLHADLRVIEADADDFRNALPEAIAALEVPLYNLHPVSKFLLARAARSEGIATLVTGDGADHVFTRDDSADYLPLVGAAFAACDIDLRTPFLDHAVIAHLLSQPVDSHKLALREIGKTLPIPQALVREPKVGKLAPPIDLSPIVSPAKLERLAALLGRARPSFDDDRDRVRWSTLALLVDAFAAWP